MFGTRIGEDPHFVRLQRRAEARPRQHSDVALDPLEPAVEEEETVARGGPPETSERHLVAEARHGEDGGRVVREMHVLPFEPQIDGGLVPERPTHEAGTDELALCRPGVGRVAHERHVGVRAIGQ